MKSTLLAIVILLLITITSSSQTIKPKSIYAKQKTFEVGGEILLTSTTYVYEGTAYSPYRDYNQVDFVINGSAGLFVIDGLKLGIEPAIQISAHENNTRTILKLYFTPEYVFDVKRNIYPYLAGSVGYTSSAYGSSTNPSGLSWGGKAGLKINVLGNALVNAGFSYYRETYNYTSSYGEVKQHYNIFGFKLGLSVFFR